MKKQDRVIRFKFKGSKFFPSEVSEFKVNDCTFTQLIADWKLYNRDFDNQFTMISHG